jgi:hypothetical protein
MQQNPSHRSPQLTALALSAISAWAVMIAPMLWEMLVRLTAGTIKPKLMIIILMGNMIYQFIAVAICVIPGANRPYLFGDVENPVPTGVPLGWNLLYVFFQFLFIGLLPLLLGRSSLLMFLAPLLVVYVAPALVFAAVVRWAVLRCPRMWLKGLVLLASVILIVAVFQHLAAINKDPKGVGRGIMISIGQLALGTLLASVVGDIVYLKRLHKQTEEMRDAV